MTSYKEQETKEIIERNEDLCIRAARDIKYRQQDQEAAKRESQLKQWAALQQRLKESSAYLNEARTKFEAAESSHKDLNARIAAMLVDGFVPPASPQPKPVVRKAEVPKPVEPKLETPYVDPHVDCPVCGQRIMPSLAYHRAEGLEDVLCIIDAKRARAAGLSAARIKSELERQRIAKENQCQ